MHNLNLYLPGLSQPVTYRIPMSDAKRPVTLQREPRDAYNGKPGYSVECMNAQCGLREAEKFPHPVYLIEFTDSRAFVVDKLYKNGSPAHCIRYYHHEGGEQKTFDRPGGKQELIKSGKVAKTFQLLAPGEAVRHVPSTHPRVINGKGIKHRRFVGRMSFARALRAGLVAKVETDAGVRHSPREVY